MKKGGHRRIRVWDPATRVFHWLLVVLVSVSWYTGMAGGLGEMDVHVLSGYAILTLVLFRVVWGFAGSKHSRFADFVHGPGTVLAYARSVFTKDYRAPLGHNPMGGWVVVMMLVVLAAQATTGLFANDDVFTEGALAAKVAKSTSDTLTTLHHVGAKVLLALVCLHLAAIATYLVVKKENLVVPMITGRKTVAADATESPFVGSWRAVAALALAAAIVATVVNL